MRSRNREINVFSISALDLFASALGAFILISVVLMPFFLRVDRAVVDQLELDLTQANEERDAARRELAQARSELQQCRQREAACLQEADELREETERLRGELSRAQGTAEEAQREAEEAQRVAEEAQREAEEARRESERAKRDAEQAEREADETDSELRQCRAELQACDDATLLMVTMEWGEDHDVDLHVIDAAGKEFSHEDLTIPGRPGELVIDTRKGPGMEAWAAPKAPPGEYQVLYNLFRTNEDELPATVKGVVHFRDGRRELRERDLTELHRPNATLAAIVTVNDDGSVEVFEP